MTIEQIAEKIRTALEVDRVSTAELRITREDDGRWRITWDASEDTYSEVTFTFAKLFALSIAFATTAIDIVADPGSDGDPTYGGGGSKGSTKLVLWVTADWPETLRTDRIPWGR